MTSGDTKSSVAYTRSCRCPELKQRRRQLKEGYVIGCPWARPGIVIVDPFGRGTAAVLRRWPLFSAYCRWHLSDWSTNSSSFSLHIALRTIEDLSSGFIVLHTQLPFRDFLLAALALLK